MKLGTWRMWVVGILMAGLVGCAGSAAPSGGYRPHSSAPGGREAATADLASPQSAPPATMSAEGAAGGEAESSSPGAPPAAKAASADGAGARVREEARRAEPAEQARPGLGTGWGETRESRTTTAPFVRDSASNPFNVTAIYYNDREGANAMARQSDYRSLERNTLSILGGGLTVSLRDESGRTLPGFSSAGRQYAVGEAGSRYTIVVQNNTRYRFECVATVDGLDVIDGQAGSFVKRGYLIQPYATLEIDGWRRSANEVAAFRFSSVRGSYSNRSGQGSANVGVIGVALFNERGTNPVWTPEELNRRQQADPFPGRYAVPPGN